MLLISTSANETSLRNVAKHLLRDGGRGYEAAVGLVRLLPQDKELWDVLIQLGDILVTEGQPEEAEQIICQKLLAGVSVCKVVENIENVKLIMLLCSLLIYLKKVDIVLRMFSSDQFKRRVSSDLDFEIKIKVINALTQMGDSKNSRNLLSEIRRDRILDCRQRALVGKAYIYLRLYENAFRMLMDNAVENSSDSVLSISRTTLMSVAGDISGAYQCNRGNIKKYGVSGGSIAWNTRLLNMLGRPKEAVGCARDYLSRCLGSDGEVRFVIYEMGRALRNIQEYTEALERFSDIAKCFGKPNIYQWIGRFEGAMTLIYMEDYDQAKRISGEGASIRLPFYHEDMNVCKMLSSFLEYGMKNIAERERNLAYARSCGATWPLPHVQYHLISYLILAVLYDRSGKPEMSRNVLVKCVEEEVLVPSKERMDLLFLLKTDRRSCVHSKKVVDAFSRVLFPCNSPESYDRRSLWRLVNVQRN